MATMINHKKRLAYLHFEKTGGWTVYQILKEFDFEIMPDPVDGYSMGRHITALQVPQNYTSFGYVRHPVNWYISLYNWLETNEWCLHKNKREDRKGYKEIDFTDIYQPSLNKFIEAPVVVKECTNGFNYFYKFLHFFAMGTDQECQIIGRFEEMFDHLDTVLKLHNIHATDYINKMKQVKINQSITKDTYISPHNLEFIYESCDYIFNRFNYTKKNKYDNSL